MGFNIKYYNSEHKSLVFGRLIDLTAKPDKIWTVSISNSRLSRLGFADVVQETHRKLSQMHTNHSWFYFLVLPWQTSTGKGLITSLFPMTTYYYYLNNEKIRNVVIDAFKNFPYLLIDMFTLIFRIITMIPRALYQYEQDKKNTLQPLTTTILPSIDDYAYNLECTGSDEKGINPHSGTILIEETGHSPKEYCLGA